LTSARRQRVIFAELSRIARVRAHLNALSMHS
jgi:hypothetical protein